MWNGMRVVEFNRIITSSNYVNYTYYSVGV